MNSTKKSKGDYETKLTVDTVELQSLLGCGRHTAREVGLQAGACIRLGKRVLWNLQRIQEYLDTISEGREV